jgi:ABC-type nitrate/sulfonate/bicarbonate transport system ATPase subunit
MRVELQDVRKSYLLPGGGLVTVLKGVDLSMESGALCNVIGPSGCGKTTLLNIIGGLARPTSGFVRLEGKVRAGCGAHRPGSVAHVFQEPFFLPELTVRENLFIPVLRCRDRFYVERVEHLLESFGLAEMFDLSPTLLSWGEKQRLNLARALTLIPRLLLLDEPASCLDDAWRVKAMEVVMREVREARTTLLVASRCVMPPEEGFRLVRIQSGKVIEDGDNNN